MAADNNSDRMGDVTSPARQKSVLADALNAQMSDEMLAIRFQQKQWLTEARKVVEQQSEPRFGPEQIYNAQRLARQLLHLPKLPFTDTLKKQLSIVAHANSSSGQQPNDRQVVASALNQLLQGKLLSVLSKDTFKDVLSLAGQYDIAIIAMGTLTDVLSLPQKSSRSFTPLMGANSVDVLLANRLMLEQTYANYVDKATPRPSPIFLQGLNRRMLTQTYPAEISDYPRPAPSNATIAERQGGRLAWLTFVGLNVAICLGVIFAAVGIIFAAGQNQWERSIVMRLRREEIKQDALKEFWQTADAAPIKSLLTELKKKSDDHAAQQQETPIKKTEGMFSLTDDDLIRRLNTLLTYHNLPEGKLEEITISQRVRLKLYLVQPTLEQRLRIYTNYHKLIEFNSWVILSEWRKEHIKRQHPKLKYARDAEKRLSLYWQQLILAFVLTGFFFAGLWAMCRFPGNSNDTLSDLLAITARQDLPELAMRLIWFERISWFAAILLTIAVSVLLAPPSQEDRADMVSLALHNAASDKQQNLDDEVALFYSRKMQYLRNILYISTAVLASSVLQVSYTYNWALTYLSVPHDSALYKQVEQLTKIIIMERGVYYTLMLAAIYFPAYAVLRSLVAKLAEEAWRHQTSIRDFRKCIKRKADYACVACFTNCRSRKRIVLGKEYACLQARVSFPVSPEGYSTVRLRL